MSEQPYSDHQGATRLAEAERFIAEMYRFAGSSAEVDHELWRKAKAYCKKYDLGDVNEMVFEP